jgi:hypothetical protein
LNKFCNNLLRWDEHLAQSQKNCFSVRANKKYHTTDLYLCQ